MCSWARGMSADLAQHDISDCPRDFGVSPGFELRNDPTISNRQVSAPRCRIFQTGQVPRRAVLPCGRLPSKLMEEEIRVAGTTEANRLGQFRFAQVGASAR